MNVHSSPSDECHLNLRFNFLERLRAFGRGVDQKDVIAALRVIADNSASSGLRGGGGFTAAGQPCISMNPPARLIKKCHTLPVPHF